MNSTVACKAVRRPACLAQAKRRPAPAPARPVCPKLGARAVRCQAHEHEHPALSSQEVVHRAERLVELAHEFMHQWIKATREGPTEQVISSLNTIVDNKLLFRTSHLLGGFEAVGLDGLRDKLTLDKHRAGAVRPKKVVMCAANDESDSVFCLLECDEVPPEGTPAPVEGVKHGAESIKHGAETVIEKASQGMEQAKGMVTGTEPSMKQEPSIQHGDRRMYGIVKFDTLLDDTKRIITGVTERCQLGRGETSLLSVHLPATTEGQMPKERMQEEMEVMLKAAGITHFPSERIKELTMQGPTIDMTAAKANVEKWCRARSSGEDERALLDEALEFENFRLWDAYGVLPLVCGLKAKGADISSPNKCLMDKETVMEIIREAKASHDISVSLLDSAICSRHNVGFSHWRSHISPKSQEGQQGGQQGSKQDICIEGLEILVFNGDGRIMDIWMMRDPMPEERKMLEETAKKAGVKF